MGEDAILPGGRPPVETPPPPPPPSSGWGWKKYVLGLPLGLVAGAGALLLGLDTPIGHRLIADALEGTDIGRGVRLSVARIEGSIYGAARLEGLTLRDRHGVFLRAGEGTLDWRPLEWFARGLVIRDVAVRRATLLRRPELAPSTGPTQLPDFDITIDHFAIERMNVAKPVAGSERRVDLAGGFHLAKGVIHLSLDGRLGGEDRLAALVDAQPKKDIFALKFTYDAPKGGLLAALAGSAAERHIRIDGKGTWASWKGRVDATQDGKPAVKLGLGQAGGMFTATGDIFADPLFSPDMRRTLGGSRIAVDASGQMADSRLTGKLALAAQALSLKAAGGVDLAKGRFDKVKLALQGGPKVMLGDDDSFADLRAEALLDGPFAHAATSFSASTARWNRGSNIFDHLRAEGSASRTGAGWRIPLRLTAGAVRTEGGDFDERLHPVTASGTLNLGGGRLTSDDLVLAIPLGHAQAALRGDLKRGIYILSGRAALHDWPTGVGKAKLDGAVVINVTRGQPWWMRVQTNGSVPDPAGGAARLAGGAMRFSGLVEVGGEHHLLIQNGHLNAPAIDLAFSGGRDAAGHIAVQAKGEQRQYGAFSGSLALVGNMVQGSLHLPDPMPAAGIRNVDIDLTPEPDALRIEAKGDSLLGPFAGAMGLSFPPAPAHPRLTVRGLVLSDSYISGAIDLASDGVEGKLTVSGGGVSGTVALAPRVGGQGVDATLAAQEAHFGGAKPLTIAKGRLVAHGLIQKHHTTLSGELSAQGVGRGGLFIGRLAAAAQLTDGSGRVTAAIGGRRGSGFDMQATADVAPDRVALLAGGSYAGQSIAMPRRAVFTAEQRPDGTTSGWRLAPAQIDFGGGRLVAQGVLGNGSVELALGMADMPLSVGDVVFPDLGLGGKASGRLTFIQKREAAPQGEAALMVKGLTRSGLVLVSRPVDVAVVSRLGAQSLDLRAVASEGGKARGRLQARIDHLAGDGTLPERLLNGRLVGQMRYAGPADALWRLMAINNLDLSGPVEIAADLSGSLDDPRIRGSLAGDGLRMQSGAAGMDITGISARGGFSGSTLTLSSLSGKAAGGQIVGSGMVGFGGMEGGRGPTIDIALAASKAQLLSRPDMAMTVTGPIRILSDGKQGTIAGRLTIDKANWKLGKAQGVADLPSVPVREINRRTDVAPGTEKVMPWRLMVDASGGSIRVQGLGMDSNWNADVKLRGAMLDPSITGAASMVEGSFDFASKHFDLTYGRITFAGQSPPDPRLDIAASASLTGLTATVNVRGTASKTEITFSSVPALPEEELLARILFGDSITQISAPEAIQLGAALAALHGGGGLDPINKLRSAVGLDRLRFLSADTTIGRQQAVAVGKYLHRHIYVELVSDGRGYTASNLEFRLTSWLALLGTMASNQRQSVNVKLSKDY